MSDDSHSQIFTGWRFIFTLPSFDESTNSFSRLLVPVIEDLLRLGAEVQILSSNATYSGAFTGIHRTLRRPRFRLAALDYLSMVVASTFWVLQHRAPRTIVHNIGVGACLVQDVMTAHACHAAWVARKRIYGRLWTAFFNPLHPLVLLVEWLNYVGGTPTIAVSREVAEQIRYHHRRDVVTIPNGLLMEATAVPAATPWRPSRQGMVIAFASNDHGKKGLGELLDALALAAGMGRNWRVEVFGADPAEPSWRERVARQGLSQRVTFHGHVNDLATRLATADVFCLPSHYEAFGLVYLDAALAGIPVVGSHGVYPELVGDEFPGLPLLDPMEGEAIFSVLAQIEDDALFRARLTEQVARRAQTYTQEKMVAETISLYADIIATRT